jgi:hypothetical protein
MGFGVSNWSKFALLGMAALVCSSVVEADENWSKIYENSNIVFFSPREIRDKNKESSIYAQN